MGSVNVCAILKEFELSFKTMLHYLVCLSLLFKGSWALLPRMTSEVK